MSTASFAIRGFCPNVLALKAVLMILDLPDFSDEWQIANALTDTGLIPRMYGPPRDCKGKFGREDKSAQMYSAFWWRWSPGHDELRAYLSF